jgi:hypothetical protein
MNLLYNDKTVLYVNQVCQIEAERACRGAGTHVFSPLPDSLEELSYWTPMKPKAGALCEGLFVQAQAGQCSSLATDSQLGKTRRCTRSLNNRCTE